jgi:hypothetical protein
MKKLRLRAAARANAYKEPFNLSPSPNKARITKIMRLLQADLAGSSRKEGQPERLLGELCRLLESRYPERETDLNLVRQLGHIRVIVTVCTHYCSLYGPAVVALGLRLLCIIVYGSVVNREYMVLANQMYPLVPVLTKALSEVGKVCRWIAAEFFFFIFIYLFMYLYILFTNKFQSQQPTSGPAVTQRGHDTVLAPALTLFTCILRHPAEVRDRTAKDDLMRYGRDFFKESSFIF